MSLAVFKSGTRHFQAQQPAAFTLVELLVVIGIIALLISILLPALNKARQSANQTKCMANLRSIGQAMQIYVTMQKGMLPFGFVREGVAPTGFPIYGGKYIGPIEHWDTLMLWAVTSSRSESQYSKASTGRVGSRGMFVCPQVSIESTVEGRVLHYSSHPVLFPDLEMNNQYLYLTTNPRRSEKARTYKLSKLRRAADIAGIFDAVLDNTDYMGYSTAFGLHNYAVGGRPSVFASTYLIDDLARTGVVGTYDTPVNMAAYETNGLVNSDSPTNDANIRFRHSNDTKANALMMDGHVQTFSFDKRKPVTEATDMTLRNILVPPNN